MNECIYFIHCVTLVEKKTFILIIQMTYFDLDIKHLIVSVNC
jgi:hypothetical protein